jgi:hypothetical protein
MFEAVYSPRQRPLCAFFFEIPGEGFHGLATIYGIGRGTCLAGCPGMKEIVAIAALSALQQCPSGPQLMRRGEAAGDGGDGTSVPGGVFRIDLRERADSGESFGPYVGV